MYAYGILLNIAWACVQIILGLTNFKLTVESSTLMVINLIMKVKNF